MLTIFDKLSTAHIFHRRNLYQVNNRKKKITVDKFVYQVIQMKYIT